MAYFGCHSNTISQPFGLLSLPNTVTGHLYKYIECSLCACVLQGVPKAFWSEDLFQVVVACALQPSLAGFDTGDVEVMESLPKEVCLPRYVSMCPQLYHYRSV